MSLGQLCMLCYMAHSQLFIHCLCTALNMWTYTHTTWTYPHHVWTYPHHVWTYVPTQGSSLTLQQSWVSSSGLLACVSISSVLRPSKEAACYNTLCLCDQLMETGLPTLESCHMSCRARAARALVLHGLECCLFLQCTCCIHLDHSLYGSKS